MAGFDRFSVVTAATWPTLSIYVPTARETGSALVAATGLRNLLADAAARLAASGVRRPTVQELLQPAERLAADVEAWERPERGLALFLSPGQYLQQDLPIGVPTRLVLGHHVFVRPMLQLWQGDDRFFLLSLSAGQVRLERCTRFACEVQAVPGMPASLQVVIAETEVEPTVQVQPQARRGLRGASAAVAGHGLESPNEVRKTEFVEFLRRVADATARHLAAESAPLVLAGEPEILGNFRKIARIRTLVAEAIEANPFALDPAELRTRAHALLKPRLERPLIEVCDVIAARLGTAEPTVSLRVEEILGAARFGRVSALLVDEEAMLWGRFDESGATVEAKGTPGPEDDELLNLAALHTIAHGGAVYSLAPAAMPQHALAAALLRY